MSNYSPWAIELVICELDYPLAAERLQIEETDLRRWAANNSDEILECAYGYDMITFEAITMRDIESMKPYDFNKQYEIRRNRPVASINNIQNNLTIDNGTNPREVLEAELDRLNSRTLSNGHERPREIS